MKEIYKCLTFFSKWDKRHIIKDSLIHLSFKWFGGTRVDIGLEGWLIKDDIGFHLAIKLIKIQLSCSFKLKHWKEPIKTVKENEWDNIA